MRQTFVAVFAAVLAGCGASPDTTTVTVFAASSLKAPFTEIGRIYEQQYPGTAVAFSFAGSADLVAQVDQGAPANALATADEPTMTASGLPDAMVFATNTMTIAVAEGNPGAIRGLRDLSDPALSVVVCAPQVPCGAATATIARSAGISIAADSEESSVADVLGKVSSGQADAGIVYVSDLRTATGVEQIPIPAAVNTTNRYLIASVDDAGRQFTDLVLSEEGQAVLARDGFGPP